MRYLLIMLLVGTTLAAPLPDAPSAAKRSNPNPWKPDITFYMTTAGHIAATAVDVRFVQNCEHQHTCIEANAGKDRWSGRWPEIVLGAGVTYGCQLMLHDHKIWRRVICPLPVIGWSLYNAIDGTRIEQIRGSRLVKR